MAKVHTKHRKDGLAPYRPIGISHIINIVTILIKTVLLCINQTISVVSTYQHIL